MKRSYHTIALFASIFVGSLLFIGAASALEYQTNSSTGDNPVTLKFEFGQTLTISTGGNISIASLTPGTKAISNSNYNVTVSTNNLTGYTLSATVGCSSGIDCYDNKNLSDGTNNFSMLSADGTLTSGTWGVSLDSTATENSSFKTLAKYDETATILNQTTSNTGTAATGYTGTSATTVRIGAYATNSQVAGTYTNSINFIAVANALPEFMQDMTSARLAALMPNENDTAILYDKRDGQQYTAAKLADGKYWMTKNLNLAGGTALSYTDTDFESSYTLPTTDGWTVTNNKLVLPASDNGDTSFSTDNVAYVYNSGSETCGSGSSCYSYYSWDAATLGSGRSISAGNVNAPYSICPKGWHLPTTTSTNGSAAEATDFRALMIALGGSNSIQTYDNSTTPTGATLYGLIGPGTTPNFFLAGYYSYGSLTNGGYGGSYWSATSNAGLAQRLLVSSTSVNSATSSYRSIGFGVRCVFGG